MPALRPILLGASILTLCGALAVPAQARPVVAQQSIEFNIPAQDLGAALNELGRQAAITIAFPSEAVAGRRSAPLRGRFTAADAARRLVAGTGLRVTERGGGALVLLRNAAPARTAAANGASAQSADANPAEEEQEVVVTGALSGVATSIARQKAATTVKNVVSSDDFAKLPDFNAAESLRRLPGISMVEDHGEGRFISIRGARPNYNGTMFNGFTVPTADSESHRVDLQTIPNTLIERIEVNKTMTPDLPGEGIGGSVNIVARNPAEIRKLTAGASLYGGVQQYHGSEIRADGYIADRFGPEGQFGFSLTGSFRQNERRAYISEPEDWQQVPSSNGGEVWAPSEISQTAGEFKQRSVGVDAAFGGSFDNLRFQIRGFYSLSNLPGTENSLTQSVEPAETGGVPTDFDADGGLVDGSISRSLSYKEWNLALYGVQTTMDADLGSGWSLDLGHSFQQAREHYPNRLDIRSTEADFTGLPLQIASDRASLGPFSGTLPGALQPGSVGVTFYQRGGRFDDQSEQTVYANLRKQIELGNGDKLELKAGTYLRFIDQGSDNVATRWTVLAGQSVSFGEFMTDSPAMVRDGIYFGSLSSFDQAHSLLADNQSKFGPAQIFYTRGVDVAADFAADVTIQAYYGMATWRHGPFTVIGGGRFETAKTRFERLGEDAGIGLQRFEGSSSHFLPSVHLRYDITPELVARASWSNTTARPDPENVYANESRDDVARTITRPNPGLEPLTSENFDASLDWYFGPLGYVSIGAFKKNIDNYPLVTQSNVTIDGELYAQFTTQAGASGKIEGFEAAFRHQFDKLPGLLGGFGLELNYAHIDSTLLFAPRPDRPPLAEQPEDIFNAGLVYAKGPVFARLSLSYTGDSIDDGGMSDDGPGYDEIISDRTTLDLSASYNLSERLQLFAEWRNITNSTAITYSGERNRLISWESFGTTAGLGLRLRY
ncbi:TonB-dependent receptor [Sphingomonas sp. BT-65]|uniref:TonB-dependent receptor n=1 Tax=Sphingomonas sp. BT-65 TaxID=2989821 RepID=UPI0022362B01|nr:TonB-dependent receptor [Sphingomonas sp. BT-65]MCW4463332.1 TonB-dependent receptor [Sphingomonas sp. BT-65]